MKKAKRVISLVLAAIMIFAIAVPTAFAKTDANNYEVANIYPNDYVDGVQKYKFTAEQGSGYVLDLLDTLLYNAHFVVETEVASQKIVIKFDSIDNIFYYLYTIIDVIKNGSLTNTTGIKILAPEMSGLVATIVGGLKSLLSGQLGDLKKLDVSALGNQYENTRICRNVTAQNGLSGKSDLTVLMTLIEFLKDNADYLGDITTNDFELGSLLLGVIPDNIKMYITDLPGSLKKLLYQKLVNSDYDTEDELPSGVTVDSDLQNIINWALISGTGTESADGGKSILGENFEAFLPDIANYPGGASIDARTIQADRGQGVKSYTMNFYQLVNNAINALLSGFVSDKLEDLLIDLLDIDPAVNDGRGDTAIMQDMIFTAITGAIEGLCVANGAPSIDYNSEEETYPIPKIEKLLHWFFVEGGLATFVDISYSGIQLTDNFMSLLNDVARALPGLFPLFGFEVPTGLTYTNEEMNEKWVDKYGDDIYLSYYGQKVQGTAEEAAEQLYKHVNETTGNVYYTFVSSGAIANTTDDGQSDYINPNFIRPKYVLSNNNIYAALVKILLNHFIDGCYFPEWADSIPAVGAYALASLAAQYIPENNYFDRLDAYHAAQIGETYTPRAGQNITAMPYTEVITLKSGTVVTIPRAAMDIGASLGAYLLSGWQDFPQGLGFQLETDTNFEVFALEFLTWAGATYMPIFAGKWNSATRHFDDLDSNGTKGTWVNAFNTAIGVFNTSRDNHEPTGTSTSIVNNIPASEVRNALYDLVDSTVFVLIPYTWLPDWVATDKSAGLINSWLCESLCTLDLQKIISLFGVNSTGELNNSVTKVLLNLVDRVLGTVFGGKPLLTSVDRASVFTSSTTITNFENLIGTTSNTPLKNLVIKLCTHLYTYGRTLCKVIMPLLLSGTVKASEYYPSKESNTKLNYLGSGTQITVENLQNYIDDNDPKGDLNATLFSGNVYFSSEAKAADVADKIGASFNPDTDYEVIDGSTKYKVYFPSTYTRMSYAETATTYVENSYAKRFTEKGNRVFKLYVQDNYRTGTSTETVSTVSTDPNTGAITERAYTYTGIESIEADKSNNTYQTGTKGEVSFPDGYRTSAREDFRANQLFYANRYINAVDDANEFIDSFNTYAHSTLPDAYGSWIMYFVKMQLKANGLIDGDVGTPGKKTPYPFYISGAGQSYESYIGPLNSNYTTVRNVWATGTSGQAYPYSFNNSYQVVAEALAYADALEEDGSNHDVTFGIGDTELIVRLAIGRDAFTITGKNDEEIAAAWAALSSANRTAITNLCNGLGITFDSANNKITRKSFKLINASINGKSKFDYKDSSNQGSISITPATTYTPGGKDTVAVNNEIQQSYILFAKTAKEFNDHLNDYYDNLSWRIANREAALEGNTTDKTSLVWVLGYTHDAYVNSEGKRNMKKNSFGYWTTAYTAKSYDEFQRAYEYGLALKTELEKASHNHILQSLITEAYKAILKAYYNLHDFDAKPDWTTLEQLREMARAIINGPLGVGAEVDRDVGYTMPTLNNLVAALAHADDFYNNNQGQDIEFQDDIDEEATILNAVIAALAFPEGIVPGAIKDPNPANDSDLDILDSIGETDCTWTRPGDARTYKVILGMEEGVNFTDGDGTMPTYNGSNSVFTSSGYTVNGTSNDFKAVKGSYGGGTGSYLVGRVNFAEAFKYYAVLIGDVNGDARIDSADKTIINMIIANESESELEPYIGVAADVNHDGHVTADDAAIIGQKVNHVSGVEILQAAGSQTAAWFN